METSSGGNLIVPTGFSARFRAFEPAFPRSSPAAHGGWWTSYAFAACLGRLPFAQMRHQQATSCSLTPRSHIAHLPQNRILGIAFLAISLGSTLGQGGSDAEQTTAGAAHRREAGAGACGFARH